LGRIIGGLVAVALIAIGFVAWRNNLDEDKACGSAVIAGAKQVGTISFHPGAREVTVTGDFTAKANLGKEDEWRVQDTKGHDIDLQVTPRPNGNTGFRNNGGRAVVFMGGPGNPCANSVSPKGETDYASVGTVKVY